MLTEPLHPFESLEHTLVASSAAVAAFASAAGAASAVVATVVVAPAAAALALRMPFRGTPSRDSPKARTSTVKATPLWRSTMPSTLTALGIVEHFDFLLRVHRVRIVLGDVFG